MENRGCGEHMLWEVLGGPIKFIFLSYFAASCLSVNCGMVAGVLTCSSDIPYVLYDPPYSWLFTFMKCTNYIIDDSFFHQTALTPSVLIAGVGEGWLLLTLQVLPAYNYHWSLLQMRGAVARQWVESYASVLGVLTTNQKFIECAVGSLTARIGWCVGDAPLLHLLSGNRNEAC